MLVIPIIIRLVRAYVLVVGRRGKPWHKEDEDCLNALYSTKDAGPSRGSGLRTEIQKRLGEVKDFEECEAPH